jgi:hypothetical protein
MSHRKAKKIRKELFIRGIAITAKPYMRLSNGQIIASSGRRGYQKRKEGLI